VKQQVGVHIIGGVRSSLCLGSEGQNCGFSFGAEIDGNQEVQP